MSTPLQVARAAERADQIIASQNTPPAAVSAGDPPVIATPPADQPADPTPPVDNAAEIERLRKELEKSEQRYRTARGMHDADRARFNEQIVSMQERLRDLEERGAAAATPPAQVTAPKDVEEFGQDTIDFVLRTARAVIQAEVPALAEQLLAARLTPVQSQVAQVAAHVGRTAEQEFFHVVAARVPDWEALNTDAAFIDWLRNVEPLSGVPYQAILSNAREQLDAGRAVAVFDRYKAEAGVARPAPAPRPAVDERASLVEPSRTASAAPRAPGGAANKRQWTRAQVSQFYADARAGKYDAAQAKQIEADIFQAQSEGRIVG